MPRRGHITFVRQVHDDNGIGEAANYYGNSASMGKSRKGLYTNNFNTNSDSIYKVTESEVVQAFYDNRRNLTATDPGDDAFNPDFPTKSIQYHYNNIANAAYNGIKIKGNEPSAANAELLNRPAIAPHTVVNQFNNRLTTTNTGGAEDLPGKYTPNLNTDGLSFQGTKTGDSVRTTARSGGGFGSDARITFEVGPNTSTATADIHDYRQTFRSGSYLSLIHI